MNLRRVRLFISFFSNGLMYEYKRLREIQGPPFMAKVIVTACRIDQSESKLRNSTQSLNRPKTLSFERKEF